MEAVIFDLDETVVVSQNRFHASAESAVLAGYGVHVVPEDISRKYAGRATRAVFMELASHLDPDILYEEKWVMVRKMIEEGTVESIPGMIELIIFLKDANIPICIASASPRWYIELIFNKPIAISGKVVYLKDFFGTRYVSAEEVLQPKPHPDVFLKAAEVLGVPPVECLVIGDGYSDVVGGLNANMSVVFIGEHQERVALHAGVKMLETGPEVRDYVESLFK